MGLILSPIEEEHLAPPDALAVIVAHVANGGHLEDLCKTWGVNYARVRMWMREDPERDKAYITAMNDRAELQVDRLNKGMNELANRSNQGILADDGTLLPPSKWPAEVLAAVDSFNFDTKTKRLKSVTFVSKAQAQALAGKSLAMFRDQIDINGKLSFEDMVVAADKTRREKIIDVKSAQAVVDPQTIAGLPAAGQTQETK